MAKMLPRIAFALALTMGTALRAVAENTCGEFKQVFDARSTAFGSFQSNFDEAKSAYRSKVRLPGARECWVKASPVEYQCSWKYSDTTEDKTLANFDRLVDLIEVCLPGDAIQSAYRSPRDPDNPIARFKVYLKRENGERGFKVEAVAYYFDRDGGRPSATLRFRIGDSL